MSKTLDQVRSLIKIKDVRISAHGYDELIADNIFAREVLDSVENAILVEDYPDFHKGASVLVLQEDKRGKPIHVVWGIPKGAESPAVLITAYRPDSTKWTADFKRRIK
ncbi:MAG: hypothetical protein B5M51_08730 [Anaerolinea sp. 4484_236]|nr:MAG: hypothetical protein B5M51_08730 [Anaerolinea sp. 4484_236]